MAVIDLLSEQHLQLLLRHAARVCVACLRGEEVLFENCPERELEARGGAFVTLTRKGALAGCIGYLESQASLWETVGEAAQATALQDSRFERIPRESLPECAIEISVLSESQPIAPEAIEPGRHGLIIDCAGRRGLLLPQVATEHGLDREGFLDALTRKAGLPPRAWEREDCTLEAFEAQLAKGALLELCEEGGRIDDERR
jgi:AmmeMemoRadiSam system protein A